jgi:hypothetical protein
MQSVCLAVPPGPGRGPGRAAASESVAVVAPWHFQVELGNERVDRD